MTIRTIENPEELKPALLKKRSDEIYRYVTDGGELASLMHVKGKNELEYWGDFGRAPDDVIKKAALAAGLIITDLNVSQTQLAGTWYREDIAPTRDFMSQAEAEKRMSLSMPKLSWFRKFSLFGGKAAEQSAPGQEARAAKPKTPSSP